MDKNKVCKEDFIDMHLKGINQNRTIISKHNKKLPVREFFKLIILL